MTNGCFTRETLEFRGKRQSFKYMHGIWYNLFLRAFKTLRDHGNKILLNVRYCVLSCVLLCVVIDHNNEHDTTAGSVNVWNMDNVEVGPVNSQN